MKKYNFNKKEFDFQFILSILISVLFLLALLLLPAKEIISCKNKICSVKDYSILITYNRAYDLNNIILYSDIGRSGRGRKFWNSYYLRPISKCAYFSENRANKDKFLLENNDSVYLKHISRDSIFLFIFFNIIAFICIFLNKKLLIYYKYFLLLFLIRLIYILVI